MEVNGSDYLEADDEIEFKKININNCRGIQILIDELFVLDSDNNVQVYDISEIKDVKNKNFEEETFDFSSILKNMDNVDKSLLNMGDSNKPTQNKKISEINIKHSRQMNFEGGEKIKQISAGLNHVLFLSHNGTVFALGEDTFGQCGQGRATTDNTLNSVKKTILTEPKRVLRLPEISQIAAGVQHSLFLTQHGIVFGCGLNNH